MKRTTTKKPNGKQVTAGNGWRRVSFCHTRRALDNVHHAICARVVRLLKEERERQGLSKYAVAHASGLSQQAVGYVEAGERMPSLETTLKLAGALKVDLGKLIQRAQREAIRR